MLICCRECHDLTSCQPLSAYDVIFLLALSSADREKERDEYILQADQLYYLRRISQGLTGVEKDYPPSVVIEMGRQHAENKKRAAQK